MIEIWSVIPTSLTQTYTQYTHTVHTQYTHTHTHTHTYMHTLIYTYTHTQTSTYLQARTYQHTHMTLKYTCTWISHGLLCSIFYLLCF